jgi:hypothetical protein
MSHFTWQPNTLINGLVRIGGFMAVLRIAVIMRYYHKKTYEKEITEFMRVERIGTGKDIESMDYARMKTEEGKSFFSKNRKSEAKKRYPSSRYSQEWEEIDMMNSVDSALYNG